MKKQFLCMITAAILLLTPACSASSAGTDENPATAPESGGLAQAEETLTNPPAEKKPSIWDEPGEKELSISLCWGFYDIEETVEKFKKAHPEVNIVLNKFENDYEKYMAQTATALMSGTAADLLDTSGIDYAKYADSGHLADIYPLMQADSDFRREDYYTNVFDAMAYKNGIYTFPACFGYRVTGVNNTFSEALVSLFTGFDAVNDKDLMDMYSAMENKENFYIDSNFDPLRAVTNEINNFMDYENKRCDFNSPQFIDLITAAKNATDPEKTDGYFSSNLYSPEQDLKNSKRYLFKEASSDNIQYFLPFEEEGYYSHFVPVTGESGKLVIYPMKNFSINENARSKELAWEFIKFMTTPEANEDIYIPQFPVHKAVLKTKIDELMANNIGFFEENNFYHLNGDVQEHTDKIVSIMDKFNQMPMECPILPNDINMLIYENLKLFTDGVMTAEQVASDLQNKISIMLME